MTGKVPDREFGADIYIGQLVTWDAGLSILDGKGRDAAKGVFQSVGWLKAWNLTIGRSAGRPFMISVRERRGDTLVAMLPLLLRRADRLRIIEWADCGVSDYNAPILGAAAPAHAAGARAMWRAAKKVLPAADVVRFTKMPATIEGRPNPLTLLPQARASPMCGHTLIITSTWDSYLESLERRFRKELRRSWRVFTRDETAVFGVVNSDDEARRVLTTLEIQQGERFKSNSAYLLDRPDQKSFYRELTASGLRNGEAMLTTLTCKGEVVAALLGLVSWPRYVMIRISADHARWSYCSPGRLIIVETLRLLHERGFTTFDFSIGEYAYKRRLGAKSDILFEFTNPVSPFGLAFAAYDRAKQTVRQYPRLKRIARALFKGK